MLLYNQTLKNIAPAKAETAKKVQEAIEWVKSELHGDNDL